MLVIWRQLLPSLHTMIDCHTLNDCTNHPPRCWGKSWIQTLNGNLHYCVFEFCSQSWLHLPWLSSWPPSIHAEDGCACMALCWMFAMTSFTCLEMQAQRGRSQGKRLGAELNIRQARRRMLQPQYGCGSQGLGWHSGSSCWRHAGWQRLWPQSDSWGRPL